MTMGYMKTVGNLARPGSSGEGVFVPLDRAAPEKAGSVVPRGSSEQVLFRYAGHKTGPNEVKERIRELAEEQLGKDAGSSVGGPQDSQLVVLRAVTSEVQPRRGMKPVVEEVEWYVSGRVSTICCDYRTSGKRHTT